MPFALSLATWSRGRRLAVLAGYWVTLFIATHWPTTVVNLSQNHNDKLVHFAAFGLLAWLVAWWWSAGKSISSWRLALGVCLVVVVYAAVDELLQIPVGRDGNLYDWLADVCGALVAIAFFVSRRRK